MFSKKRIYRKFFSSKEEWPLHTSLFFQPATISFFNQESSLLHNLLILQSATIKYFKQESSYFRSLRFQLPSPLSLLSWVFIRCDISNTGFILDVSQPYSIIILALDQEEGKNFPDTILNFSPYLVPTQKAKNLCFPFGPGSGRERKKSPLF